MLFGFTVSLDTDLNEDLFIMDKENFIESARYDAAFIHIFNKIMNSSERGQNIYVFYKDEKDIAECKMANALKFCFPFSFEGNEMPNAHGHRVCFRKIGKGDVVKYGGADISAMYFIGVHNFEEIEFRYLITRIRTKHVEKENIFSRVKGIAPIGKMPEWLREYERELPSEPDCV